MLETRGSSATMAAPSFAAAAEALRTTTAAVAVAIGMPEEDAGAFAAKTKGSLRRAPPPSSRRSAATASATLTHTSDVAMRLFHAAKRAHGSRSAPADAGGGEAPSVGVRAGAATRPDLPAAPSDVCAMLAGALRAALAGPTGAGAAPAADVAFEVATDGPAPVVVAEGYLLWFAISGDNADGEPGSAGSTASASVYSERCEVCSGPHKRARDGGGEVVSVNPVIATTEQCVVGRCERGCVARFHTKCFETTALPAHVVRCAALGVADSNLASGPCLRPGCDGAIKSVNRVDAHGKMSVPEAFWRVVDEAVPERADVATTYPGAHVTETVPVGREVSLGGGGAAGAGTCDAEPSLPPKVYSGIERALKARCAALSRDTAADGTSGAAAAMFVPSDVVGMVPKDARVVLLLGPVGSGKTTALRALLTARGAHPSAVLAPVVWDPSKAIVSQFRGGDGYGECDEAGAATSDGASSGDAAAAYARKSAESGDTEDDGASARLWLSRVGLNSIPSWCTPHHCLSTGQAYRADLARRIAAAERSGSRSATATGIDATTAGREGILALDDFTSHLDRRSAACCACSVGKHLARSHLCAFIASSNADVAMWLQPDTIVVFNGGGPQWPRQPPIVLRNRNAGASPRVWFDVPVRRLRDDAVPAADDRTDTLTDGPDSNGGFRGLPCVAVRAYASSSAFTFKAGDETPVRGGTVLTAEVATDHATRSCDRFFDKAFDGVSTFRVPAFPTVAELDGGSRGGSSSASPVIGVICGPSGSAKSVLLRMHFGEQPAVEWAPGVPIAQHFPSVESAEELLSAVGLRVEYHGLRGAAELSAGERSQADLARLLGCLSVEKGAATSSAAPPTVVVDEFTSALDRGTARHVAARVQCYLSSLSHRCRFIVAACHHDFVGAGLLEPTWVFDTQTSRCHWLAAGPRPSDDTTASAGDDAAGDASRDAGACAGAGAGAGAGAADNVGDGGGDVQLSAAPSAWTWQHLRLAANLRGAATGPLVCRVAVPDVPVELRRCHPSLWRRFREHHYKTPNLSPLARCFVAVAVQRDADASGDRLGGAAVTEEAVAFMATIPHSGNRERASTLRTGEREPLSDVSSPGAGAGAGATSSSPAVPGTRDPYRAHRTVVFPEWQGLGVGSRISDAVAEVHRLEGRAYYGQTVHPHLGSHRDRSPLWRPTRWNHSVSKFKIESWRQRLDGVRVRLRVPKFVYSHRYVGPVGAGGGLSRAEESAAATGGATASSAAASSGADAAARYLAGRVHIIN